ncbi:MAG: SDR family NAD(P)-dependent oxidoreductase, partial [Enterobacter roggenkampii]
FCALGSLKPNIGHLESASGISQIIKVLLQFRHKQLLPSLFSREECEGCDMAEGPFRLQETLSRWQPARIEPTLPGKSKMPDNPRRTFPRRAGVSAFGGGGSNVHIILEEHRDDRRRKQRGGPLPALVVLSAVGQPALMRQVENLRHYLQECRVAPDLAALAWTLQAGRKPMKERVAFISASAETLEAQLTAFLGAETQTEGVYTRSGEPQKVPPVTSAWIRGATLAEIAEKWVNGGDIAFGERYEGATPGRLSLPIYPFESRRYWLPTAEEGLQTEATGAETTQSLNTNALAGVSAWLARALSACIAIPAEEVDVYAPLANYHIDSVVITQLNSLLAKQIGSLPKTLLFEFQSINDLATHLLLIRGDRVMKAAGVQEQFFPGAASVPEQASTASSPLLGRGHEQTLAIIGASGRYPGAENLDEFWQVLKQGQDCIGEIPASRWDYRQWFGAQEKAQSYCRWGAFLTDIDCFDPLFFGITPREAQLMDPQERLFLQTAWLLFEDAGYALSRVPKETGVFVGAMYSEYQLLGAAELAKDNWVYPNSMHWSIANRVSYSFDFSGPSLTVDTACSSSLTALHLACESIRRGECRQAIAGGVSLSIHPAKYAYLCGKGFASPTGRCRPFGAQSDGFVPGEGVGAVLIKPLDEARADGDRIYAVIKATHINHGGKTNGYTVPSPRAQADLINAAYAKAGIEPCDVSYIEAHGTGTRLGDPIEIDGLTRVFNQRGTGQASCAIGSLKANIGHLESAAGIASIGKVLLQFRHHQLAPSLYATPLNPEIDFTHSPLQVQQTLAEWERPVREENGQRRELPRIAGISSFGAGGVNAHVVLQEYQDDSIAKPHRPAMPAQALVILSAKNAAALKRQVAGLLRTLEQESYGDDCLHDIAWTLQIGREDMDVRLALTATSLDELREKLSGFLNDGKDIAFLYQGHVRKEASPFAPLVHDEVILDAVSAWGEQGKYAQLLSLWVQGFPVDWARLYGDARPRRIALPGYAFEKERYWIAPLDAPAGRNDITASVADVDAIASVQSAILLPVWRDVHPGEGVPTDHTWRVIALCDPEGQIDIGELERALPGSRCLNIDPGGELAERYQGCALRLFDEVSGILRDKSLSPGLFQVVVPVTSSSASQTLVGLAGLLKTARRENPRFIGQLIASDNPCDMATLIKRLEQARTLPERAELRYQGDRCLACSPAALSVKEPAAMPAGALPWRDNGVYLISGGAGGLGLIFAKEIAAKAKNVSLILTGRTALNGDIQARLSAFTSAGIAVDYRQCDVADRLALQRLLAEIEAEYRRLDGVIHSAGLVRDNFIIRKPVDEFAHVLRAKVAGVVNLDELTSHYQLDFFILFSSTAALQGNPGQADYAAANAFMDAYAAWRHQRVACAERYGLSLSLNWPLWREGGMTVDEETCSLLWRNVGMTPMTTETALTLFYQGVRSGHAQLIPLAGDLPRLEAWISGLETPSTLPGAERTVSNERVREGTLQRLKALYGEAIGLAAERVDIHETFQNYGTDSRTITQLNQRLAPIFPRLSKTLFYEYQTLEEV